MDTKVPFKKGMKKKPKVTYKKKASKYSREEDEIKQLQQKYETVDISRVSRFTDLPLCSASQRGLKDAGLDTPTPIQKESVLLALQGKDVLGAAKTGSGKTIAFLLPLLEKLFALRWSSMDGLGALVITPTRELAFQIFEQLRRVGKFHDFSAGLVIGGKDLHFESKRMAQCNIIICTPGRLLQHMDENPQFDPSSLKLLILDEADRCLDMGFSNQMNAILDNLPKEDRQTLLFSATQTRSVKDLARLSLSDPVFVSVDENAVRASPDELIESYVVCSVEQKVDMLWSFLKNHRHKKTLVFVQSCKQVKYLYDLFRRLRIPMPISALYGTLNQLRRMAIYKEFCETDMGVLIATDIAARGLDFPTVDWVYQHDCPEDWKTYSHRVGRTARNKASGQALLVLLPQEEEPLIQQLKAHKFPIDKIDVNPNKIVSIHQKTAACLAKDHELKEEAQRAFQAYLKSVFLMKDKVIFDVTKINADCLAQSLGLAVTPRVRFLQRHLKAKGLALGKSSESAQKQISQSSEKDPSKSAQFFSSDSDDDDDDGVLQMKRTDHALSDNDDETLLPLTAFERKTKVVTKASIAKKLNKKNIKANRVFKFDDEGLATEAKGENLLKSSSEGKLQEAGEDDGSDDVGGGIDIGKAKAVLRAEDAYDRKKEKERVKQKHKEKKKKEKELKKRQKKEDNEMEGDSSEDESDSADNLKWLPDPDAVYGKAEEESDGSEDEQDSSERKRKWKPPKREKSAKGTKRPRRREDADSEEEQVQDLADHEELALKLLRR